MSAIMAKKKPAKDEGQTTKRETIQVPAEWHKALIRLAANWQQPKIWAFCRLVGEACKAQGLEHPSFPWEEMAE